MSEWQPPHLGGLKEGESQEQLCDIGCAEQHDLSVTAIYVSSPVSVFQEPTIEAEIPNYKGRSRYVQLRGCDVCEMLA